MLNKILNIEVSNTREDDSSNAACAKKISGQIFLKIFHVGGGTNNIGQLLSEGLAWSVGWLHYIFSVILVPQKLLRHFNNPNPLLSLSFFIYAARHKRLN